MSTIAYLMSTIACSYISPIAYQVRISYRLASTRYIPGTSTSTRLSISMSISISISTSTVSYRLPGTFISTTRYLHIDYRTRYLILPIACRSSLNAYCFSPIANRPCVVLPCPRCVCCVVVQEVHPTDATHCQPVQNTQDSEVRCGTVR